MSLSSSNVFLKRFFDIFLSLILLIALWPIILASFVVASIDSSSFGFFTQRRIGQFGKSFPVIKLRTMRPSDITTTITIQGDARITTSGRFFRKYKLDELPQLFNVLLGHMSFVGPRPDVSGYADKLRGSDRIFLSIKPGITGPASIKYRHEERILSLKSDPYAYNENVIWPDKVSICIDYIDNWTFFGDLSCIVNTLFSAFRG